MDAKRLTRLITLPAPCAIGPTSSLQASRLRPRFLGTGVSTGPIFLTRAPTRVDST